MTNSEGERPARVLVVDDQPLIRTVLARMLNKLGYPNVVVEDWGEAQPALEEGVDIVLLDLRMPEMSGFEFLGKIRKLHLSHSPTVYAVTGHLTDGTRKDIEEAGFNGFLAKPYSMRTLEQLLESDQNRDKRRD